MRCLGLLSCCSINPSPPRSNQRVEYVSEEGVVLLLGQGGVLCRSLKTAPDMNLPAPFFSVDSNTVVSFSLLFVSLNTLLLTLICHWVSSVNRLFSSSAVKFWYFFAHLKFLSLFPPEKWFRNVLRNTTRRLPLTGPLLIGLLCCF